MHIIAFCGTQENLDEGEGKGGWGCRKGRVRVRRLALDIRQTKRFMALSCFPKISPKLIIIQPGNGNAGGQGVDQGYPGQTALAGQRLWRDVGCVVGEKLC